MLVLQAVGATSANAVPASKAWSSFRRDLLTYKDIKYITSNAPLYIHQISHAWFDFRDRRDNYTNYFDNSVSATRAHKQWTLDYLVPRFPNAYSDTQWGISRSDSTGGYVSWGGPSIDGTPLESSIDGSIVPCAAAGSLVFLPNDTLAVLKRINSTYPNVWDR